MYEIFKASMFPSSGFEAALKRRFLTSDEQCWALYRFLKRMQAFSLDNNLWTGLHQFFSKKAQLNTLIWLKNYKNLNKGKGPASIWTRPNMATMVIQPPKSPLSSKKNWNAGSMVYCGNSTITSAIDNPASKEPVVSDVESFMTVSYVKMTNLPSHLYYTTVLTKENSFRDGSCLLTEVKRTKETNVVTALYRSP